MRENKYDKLLLASMALLVFSAIMLLVSGYNIYFKKTYNQNATSVASNASIPQQFRDSLSRVYSNTVNDINSNLNFATTAANDIDAKKKLGELSLLREEIVALLANKNSDADLQLAKVKIEELQQKVSLLQNRYAGVEAENRRLQGLISQLLGSKQISSTAASNNGNEKQKDVITTNNNSKTPLAAALHLFAVANTNAKEQETTTADEAEKIVGTFVVKNLPNKGNGELVVVVLQPDGKVVKNSVWESGTFESVEGKKIYSRKLYAETATEEKQLNFSLTPDKFLKGDYTMQIWYNGNMIAKMVKTLS